MLESICIHKSININIRTVMKTPKTLKFIPDHLKTKKICKHIIKKLPYLLRYVPDRCKTQKMCEKVILENGGTLKSIMSVSVCLSIKKIKKNLIN